jgi:hypothetical protein
MIFDLKLKQQRKLCYEPPPNLVLFSQIEKKLFGCKNKMDGVYNIIAELLHNI